MGKKLALYTFIDAFGWEVYKEYGFMSDTLTNKTKLKTTFGFSSAADPSILTGRYPDEHTHWSSFYYSPETSPFKIMKLLAILPRVIFDRWRIRHWMSKIIQKFNKYTGYFEIYSVPFKYLYYFDYLEKNDYFVPGGILKTDTIFDFCVDKKIPYFCSNWRLSEEQNLKIAKEVIKKGEIELMYLYLPKLDAVMHAVGTRHKKVEQKLAWLEREVRKVLEVAEEHYDIVNLYVFGDHGMANVKEDLDLIPVIEATGLKFGIDYIAMYDSTMARFWFLNDKAEEIIRDAVKDVKQGYMVTNEELSKMHVYFEDHKFGDAFFLVNAGVLLCPSFMGVSTMAGMHGYHPDDKDSYPVFLSNKSIDQDILSITDIRKTMEREIWNKN